MRDVIPNNVSNLKRCYTKNTLSIIENRLTLKCVNYQHIVNVLADEPIKFGLLIGLPITNINLRNEEDSVSKTTNNAFRHSKGLQKKLCQLAVKIKNIKLNSYPIKKLIVGFTEFRDNFSP